MAPATRWRCGPDPVSRSFLILCFLLISSYVLLARFPFGRSAMTGDTYHFEYSTVTGFFLQDDPKTDPKNFDFMTSNFGLIDQPYDTDASLPRTSTDPTPWERFTHKLSVMNRKSSAEVSYKLLYLGRHGQGYHNVAQEYYGTKAWDCYYSTLPGNGTLTWLDAALTPHGISQAQNLSHFWSDQITHHHTPPPQFYLSSPLTRAIHTAQLTFSLIVRQFNLLVSERARECIGIHTCDLRSSRSDLTTQFPPPTFTFEPGFAEIDPFWVSDRRESDAAMTARLRGVLDDIFSSSSSSTTTTKSEPIEYVSVTSHGGAIAALLRAAGHQVFEVGVGGCLPILVRARKVGGARKPGPGEGEWLPKVDCGEIHGWRN